MSLDNIFRDSRKSGQSCISAVKTKEKETEMDLRLIQFENERYRLRFSLIELFCG